MSDYVVEVELQFNPSVFKGWMEWDVPPKAYWLVDQMKLASNRRSELRAGMGFLYDCGVKLDVFEMFQVMAIVEFQLTTHIDYPNMYVWWIPTERYEEWITERMTTDPDSNDEQSQK